MSLQVTPITPRFGAEISGVDISKPLDEETKREIVALQNRWGVTVWRDTGLDDDSHVVFTRIFGDIILAPPIKGKKRFTRPELFDASNINAEGNIVDDENRRLTNRGNRLWHSDSSFMAVRAAQSLLLCHEAPPTAAPTWFADTRSAHDDLPQAMKERIEGLEARHCYFWSRRKAGYPYTEEDVDAFQHATHPLVNFHAPSGRKALYIGAHARDIVGMERDEGRALIDELNEWATQPQYVFAADYRPGDMVIWDNLCTYHRAGDFDETRWRRDMRRTTIREPDSQGPQGDVVQDMFRKVGEAAA